MMHVMAFLVNLKSPDGSVNLVTNQTLVKIPICGLCSDF